jgi:hypothetical protein
MTLIYGNAALMLFYSFVMGIISSLHNIRIVWWPSILIQIFWQNLKEIEKQN